MRVAIPVNQPASGETGVHTHMNTLRDYLQERQIESEILLAPSVGGIPEVFKEGQGGSFWPLDNIEKGADQLIGLLNNPAYYKEQSAAARRRFETHFAPELLSGQLIDFLAEVNGGFSRSNNVLEPATAAR